MQMAAAGQGAGRQEEREREVEEEVGMDHGPVRPMTCLADASFLGVVVDDLRHGSERGSELPSPSSRPQPHPAGLQYSCVGRPAGREHAAQRPVFQRDHLPRAVISRLNSRLGLPRRTNS